jgi:hypothetical protein
MQFQMQFHMLTLIMATTLGGATARASGPEATEPPTLRLFGTDPDLGDAADDDEVAAATIGYTLHNFHNNTLLHVVNGSTADGAAIENKAGNPTLDHAFVWNGEPHGLAKKLRNYHTGKCIGFDASGKPVQLTCSDDRSELWIEWTVVEPGQPSDGWLQYQSYDHWNTSSFCLNAGDGNSTMVLGSCDTANHASLWLRGEVKQ